MARIEITPDDISRSAQKLKHVNDMMLGNTPVMLENQAYLEACQKAGIEYATYAIQVLKQPLMVAALLKHSGWNADEGARIAYFNDEFLHSASLRVTMKDGEGKIEYVVERDNRGVFLDGRPNTDSEKFKRFKEHLKHHEVQQSTQWTIATVNDSHLSGVKRFVAKRECLPQDIVSPNFLPSFVRRTIEICERISNGIENEAKQKQLIYDTETSHLQALTEGFASASKILQGLLTDKT